MADDEEWQDTLGDLADIELAYQVSIDSLKLATENISIDEMTFAKEQGLIDNNELIEFVQNKRQKDTRESRHEDSDEDYDGDIVNTNLIYYSHLVIDHVYWFVSSRVLVQFDF